MNNNEGNELTLASLPERPEPANPDNRIVIRNPVGRALLIVTV